MKLAKFSGAIALGLSLMPTPVLADDPRDPAMQSRSARERDAAMIRELNLKQAEHVRQRDARYAEGWAAYESYPARREEYERQMAEWRHAVRMCQSGRYEYCAR